MPPALDRARVCVRILNEEEEMAQWLAGHLDHLSEQHLRPEDVELAEAKR